jgi:hypothetical protein
MSFRETNFVNVRKRSGDEYIVDRHLIPLKLGMVECPTSLVRHFDGTIPEASFYC